MVHFIYTENLVLIHWETEDEKQRLKRVFGRNLFVRVSDGKLCLKKNAVSFELMKHYNAVEVPAAQEKLRMQRLAPLLNKREEFFVKNEEAITVSTSIKSKILTKQPVVYEGFSSRLMNHQKAGALLAGMFDRYGFFYDTGTGKTVMALEIIKRKQVEQGARFLIVCPKTIINTAWIEDAQSFYPEMRILPLTSDMSECAYDEYMKKWQVWRGVHQPYFDTKKSQDGAQKMGFGARGGAFCGEPGAVYQTAREISTVYS